MISESYPTGSRPFSSSLDTSPHVNAMQPQLLQDHIDIIPHSKLVSGANAEVLVVKHFEEGTSL